MERKLPNHIVTKRKISYDYKNWMDTKFKEKNCRHCGSSFQPQAPSHLYCSNQCAALGIAENRYQKEYGISVKDVENMLKEQDYLCAICNTEGFAMSDKVYNTLNVDHDHKTGKVRGMLCHNCNRALGLLQDSTEILQKAINYLKGATTISKESTSKQMEAHDTHRE